MPALAAGREALPGVGALVYKTNKLRGVRGDG
jgi:hypothetical protein